MLFRLLSVHAGTADDRTQLHSPATRRGFQKASGNRAFTALLGLGILFALILTIPFLILLFFVYLILWAFTSSTTIALAAAISALLGWELVAIRHFAVVTIQVGDEGMTTDWRRQSQKTFVSWGYFTKMRHIRGPLFLVEGSGKMTFLSWMLVWRPKEFRLELATRNMLSTTPTEAMTTRQGPL